MDNLWVILDGDILNILSTRSSLQFAWTCTSFLDYELIESFNSSFWNTSREILRFVCSHTFLKLHGHLFKNFVTLMIPFSIATSQFKPMVSNSGMFWNNEMNCRMTQKDLFLIIKAFERFKLFLEVYEAKMHFVPIINQSLLV